MRALIESSWMTLQDNLGGFGVFLFAYFTMATTYALGGILFYFIDKYRVLDKYKIQKGVCDHIFFRFFLYRYIVPALNLI